MASKAIFVLTTNDPTSQIKADTASPKESIESLGSYLDKLASGCSNGGASLDMQMNGVTATQTLTVSSGVATDTAVIKGTTLTCVDDRETMNITLVADSGGSLNSKFFTFRDQSGTNKYYVWYNINSAGVDPVPTGYIAANGIAVAGATGATAATLATATTAAIVARAPTGVTATNGAAGHTIITNNTAGVATATAEGTAATGFTFTRTITGSAPTSAQYNVGLTDTATAANLAAAINANATTSLYVTAASATNVCTVSAIYPGALGNLVTTTATGGVAAGGATLTGGTNATAALMHAGL
jgi:hypothetical protein